MTQIAEEQRRATRMRQDLEKDDGRPSLGPANAPVTIVVFSDFQCPYCREFAATLKQVSSEEKKVRVIFRNLPLDMHTWAKEAAEIGACVQMQSGQAFWRLHDYLFEHQRDLEAGKARNRAVEFLRSQHDVDVTKVNSCVDRKLADRRIQRDMALAAENKVNGTPTILVNGQAAGSGAPTREHLLTLLRENFAAMRTRSRCNGVGGNYYVNAFNPEGERTVASPSRQL